ncbi:MAG: DUF2608 domain-containing protein [Candidatus Babeliaceae bacterium]|nr:DUF2608 domain-containing protein [Candidatus Babeliaceae bacterium]
MNISISKKYLVIGFILQALNIQSEIFEIKHFHEALKYISPGSIVLIDIDNTLLEPHDKHNSIGSDQWFTHLTKKNSNKEYILDLYCTTILNTHMQAVEPSIPEVLQSIQQKAMLLGFTMRSIVLAPCTVERLADNNIRLSAQIPDKGFMINNKDPVLVYHDIIFCQGKKNGETLFTVLDVYNITPLCIIMIDDKRQYLELVEKECIKRNTRFVGLRYGYLDEKVTDFLQMHA